MIQQFTATFSAVDPADNVTERNFHQFDKDGNETVVRLDASATTYDGSIDDAVAPGSCYLVDLNANGPSEASASFPLTPPSPPPPPANVPKTPSILGVTWANQSAGGGRPGRQVFDHRS